MSRTCHDNAVCVSKGDFAHCDCPVCGQEYEPVCGSDGLTYHSECRLRRESCLQAVPIEVVERNACSGCANVTCNYYSVCVPHPDAAEAVTPPPGRCECPSSCDQLHASYDLIEEVVCGTDGKTYDSECQLKIQACVKEQHIVVANRGDCDLCRDVKCKHGARCEAGSCVCPTNCPKSTHRDENVCGSDNINVRELRRFLTAVQCLLRVVVVFVVVVVGRQRSKKQIWPYCRE